MATTKQPTKTEVRKRRLTAGLSGAAAAEIIGKAPRTWRSIEQGKFKMQAEDWQTFCAEVERREQEGELIVASDEWVPARKAAQIVGRSRMYVARLMDQGRVRRVMKHSNLALYNKEDLRKIRRELLSENNATAKMEQKYYTRLAAGKRLGGVNRLASLRERGHLEPVSGSAIEGLYFPRKDVDRLAAQIEEESNLTGMVEAAKALGVTRQGLVGIVDRLISQGETSVEPVTMLSGRKAFTAEALQAVADKTGRKLS